MEEWTHTVLIPTLEGYSSSDIYNGDETALFYKSLPHRTYCRVDDKPAGCTKRKDRLTFLIIINMDGSDNRKLSVIGKAKNSRCLQKKYKMTVNKMAVDWYASKNAWMTGDIHHRIMTKFNNQMRKAGHHVLYVCDNASSHQVREYSHIKFLMLPPNATSIVQPLDQGIIRSVKRRYKKKLAERYLVSVENNKDANTILKQLDIVAATNMVHNAWKETSSTIIQNCFHKVGFKHHGLDPEQAPEEPSVAPAPNVWNKVQRWMGDVQFDEFAASKPEAPTTQPMTDKEITNLVHTENNASQEESHYEEEENPPAKLIKSTNEFLAIIDQQKAFMKRNKLPVKLVEQLETLIVGNQISLCSMQKEVTDYFKSFTQIPNPKDVYKRVADVLRDITIVDSLTESTLEMDSIEFKSINTTIASGAMNALLRNEVTPGRTSTPKRKPDGTPKHNKPESTNPPKKKLKLSSAAVRDKLMAMRDSDVSSLDTESDSQSLISSQE